MNINIIIKIDELIKRETTSSPAVMANKLNLSERTVFNYIKFMKHELNAPIAFSRTLNSYRYKELGGFRFKWNDKN
jgi:transcriptional antiterminator